MNNIIFLLKSCIRCIVVLNGKEWRIKACSTLKSHRANAIVKSRNTAYSYTSRVLRSFTFGSRKPWGDTRIERLVQKKKATKPPKKQDSPKLQYLSCMRTNLCSNYSLHRRIGSLWLHHWNTHSHTFTLTSVRLQHQVEPSTSSDQSRSGYLTC